MPIEIEVKRCEISKPAVVARLEVCGAKKVLDYELVHACEFDLKNRYWRKEHVTHRVRECRGEVIVCSKQRLEGIDEGEYKVRDEIEFVAKSFDDGRRFFKIFGLMCVTDTERRRTSYVLGGLHFDIDEFPKTPSYVEVEAIAENMKMAKALVKQGVEDILGFNMGETVNLSWAEVLRKYGHKVDKVPFILHF
ncbi:hypothetical protein HY485_04670 [Candidatus Woesearchaeota archaeon]|nr:hypothetical protein [Candidatus Woesearchaeota archaeon]